MLHGDRPIENITGDLLDRKKLVFRLAESLSQTPETVVFAVQGPWGSGKSTFLNFLKDELCSQGQEVMRFEPWWFSNADDLIVRFFEQLGILFGNSSNSKLKGAARIVSGFSTLLRPAGLFVPGLTEILSFAKDSADAIKEQAEAVSKDIVGQRKVIQEVLDEAKTKVCVLVDDLDRLSSSEIKEVFRLVKGVSALRGMAFVVAFDDRVILPALEDSGGVSYLDKIVQFTLVLPPPTQSQLKLLVEKSLEEEFRDSLEKLEWQEFYRECLAPKISTYRDVKRFSNSCRVLYPVLREEVEPLSFLMVQAVQLFYTDIYKMLLHYSSNKYRDLNSVFVTMIKPGPWLLENLKTANGLADAERARQEQVISHLFPTPSRTSFLSLERSLETYFRFVPEEGRLPNKLWVNTLSQISDDGLALIDLIEKLASDKQQLNDLLERLDLYVTTGRVDPVVAQGIATAILSTGDKLLQHSQPLNPLIPISRLLNRIIFFSIGHLEVKQARSYLIDTFGSSKCVATLARFQDVFSRSKEDDKLLPPGQLTDLQVCLPRLNQLLVKRLRDTARNGGLWDFNNNLRFLLQAWAALGKQGSVQWSLRKDLTGQPERLYELLREFVRTKFSQSYGAWAGQHTSSLAQEDLVELLSFLGWKASTFLTRARRLLKVEARQDQAALLRRAMALASQLP